MPGSPTDAGDAGRVEIVRRRTTCGSSTWPSTRWCRIVEELGRRLANRRPPLPRRQLALRDPDPLPRRHGVLGRRDGGRAREFSVTGRPSSRRRGRWRRLLRRAERGPRRLAARTSSGLRLDGPRRPTYGQTRTTRCPTTSARVPCCCTSSKSCSSTSARWRSPATAAGGRDERQICSAVPIACTLDAGAAGRAGRRMAGAGGVVGRVGRSRCHLGAARRSTTRMPRSTAAASLGQREKQCCAFFDVAIELGARRSARSIYACPRVPKRPLADVRGRCSDREGRHPVRARCRARRWRPPPRRGRRARPRRAAGARRRRDGRRPPRSTSAARPGRRSGRSRRCRATCRDARRSATPGRARQRM